MRRLFVIFIGMSVLLAFVPQPTSRAQTFRPVVRGKRGVVAGGHPLSVEAGLRILQQGGFMVLSTPGGDNQDQALLQVLLNIIEFGMNPQEAVEAARFDTQHYVSSFDDHEFLPGSLNLESRIPEKTIADLKARGHKVNVQSAWGTLSSPTVIMYNPQTGVSAAGADPRRGRYAVAW